MPIRYTLRQLEYFVAAGECGSIAAAGDKLNVSSPSISASITQLEAELGQVLFVRKRSQGLSLTDAGERLLRQSNKILKAAYDLNRMADAMSGSVQGVLMLGCLSTFAQIIVSTLRSHFKGHYPDVDVQQNELNQSEIFSALRRSDIDLALTYGLDIPPDLEFVPIIDLPPYVALPPDHILAQQQAIKIEELQSHPMVLLDLPHSADYFLSFFDDAQIKPLIAERTRDMAVMRSLVANGFGYSIANLRPLNDLSPDGKPLRFIPLDTQIPPIKLGLAMVPGAAKSPTIKAFCDFFAEMVDQDALPGIG